MMIFNFNDIDPKVLAPRLESVWDQLKWIGNNMSKSKKYRLKQWYPSLPKGIKEGDEDEQ